MQVKPALTNSVLKNKLHQITPNSRWFINVCYSNKLTSNDKIWFASHLHFTSSFSLAAAVLLSFAACANVDGLWQRYTWRSENKIWPKEVQDIGKAKKSHLYFTCGNYIEVSRYNMAGTTVTLWSLVLGEEFNIHAYILSNL